MSQVFSADSVNQTASVTVPTTTETAIVTGNFVNPPFQNAKAVVEGIVMLTVGASTTTVTMRIRRNPTAENVIVGVSVPVTEIAGNLVQIAYQVADAPIGPGPVQYQVTVQQTGATANGTAQFGNVTTMLISG